MFSDLPLSRLNSKPEDSLKEKYGWYDLFSLQKYNYAIDYKHCLRNRLSNKDIKVYTGGIRREIFNAKPWLIKHPLAFIDKKIVPAATAHQRST